MKIQLLREFTTLAELLNFTKAAQKLHITQPVLSRHIKDLEDNFGTELLRRDTHNVELTSAGVVFREEAHKIIEQYEKSMAIVNNFTGQSKLKLSIAYLGEAFRHILGDIIDEFKQRYPNISMSYRDVDIHEALEFLKIGTYDLGFVLRPSFIDKIDDFCSIPFLTDPLCIAVNKSHELATRKSVSIKEITQWPVIREDPKEFPQSEVFSTDFLKNYGLNFTIYKEYPNLKTCFFNLEINKEVVLLTPKHRLYLLGKNSVLIDIEEQDYYYNMELIWVNKNANPCVSLFIKEFRKFIEEQTKI